MDPLTALCLAIPIGVGVAVAGYLLGRALEALMGALDRVPEAATTITEAIERASIALAEAHVKAAKYQARAITVKPKPHEPAEPSTFERWVAIDGHKFPQTVQDQVEWAIGRMRGEETDDEGDEDAARVILRQYARWVEGAVDAEIKKAATGR